MKVWMNGIWEVAKDLLCQKILASHLPADPTLPDLTGFSCIVTGPTSGIGLHTARKLAMVGAHVVMACRNTMMASELVQEWQENQRKENGNPLLIDVMELDLLSLASVRSFADNWLLREIPLHILINNAGIFLMGEPQKFSKDGFEQHMQVNHMGPALLSILLLPSLMRGSPSRIVNVNSVAHHCAVVDSEYLSREFKQKDYNSFTAYAASKLAHLMFLGVLSSKLRREAAVQVIAVHPGIVGTNIVMGAVPSYSAKSFWKFDAAEGARSVLFCATAGEVRRESQSAGCIYYSFNCKPAKVSAEAANTDKCLQVWDKTLTLLGLPMDCTRRSINEIMHPAYSFETVHEK